MIAHTARSIWIDTPQRSLSAAEQCTQIAPILILTGHLCAVHILLTQTLEPEHCCCCFSVALTAPHTLTSLPTRDADPIAFFFAISLRLFPSPSFLSPTLEHPHHSVCLTFCSSSRPIFPLEYAPLKPKKRDTKENMMDSLFMAQKKRYYQDTI